MFFCTPPPLRTAMGHPPTTRHRYAPDTDPIGVHIFVWYETPFVFHMNHSDVFFHTTTAAHILAHTLIQQQLHAKQ
jgi:hypothetical protein